LLAPLRRAADAVVGQAFRVELRLPDDAPLAAVPEPTLDSVLNVLLQNSRQAGASLVVITLGETTDELVLRIADDGPGVPIGDRARLFEPFFTSRRAEGGTGLGLSIARSLLAANHGAIHLVESQVGATFEVNLPRVR
ncbi:MAG TPA: ATP-binding protein, partial [Caulobacter sp.]|nr:ATP-binding protein [Caulobacter sp.]